MNPNTLLHEHIGTLSQRLRATMAHVGALAAQVQALSKANEDKAGEVDNEAIVREVVKKELTREKAILEAGIGHKIEQHTSRTLAASSDQTVVISQLMRRIDALESKLAGLEKPAPDAPPAAGAVTE